MNRFRVRAGNKTWTDKGPDLLRTRDNARKALRGLMDPGAPVALYTRRERADGTLTDWKPAVNRTEALARFDAWARKPRGDVFQVGRGRDNPRVAAAVRVEFVRDVPTSCVSPATELARSLIEHQFPRIRFSGGYVYRRIKGTDAWSDHAWGTAIDVTENRDDPDNDETFDWCVRMARTGNMDYDYIIGSRGGEVVSASAPDFEVAPSGAAASHLWHCHLSIVDHDGRKPPREGVECP